MIKNNSAQEILSFSRHEDNYNSADFIISSSNKFAWEFINSWPEWPSHCAIIYGDKMCGKTHLARIWADNSKAILIEHDTDISSLDGSKNYILENIATSNPDNRNLLVEDHKLLHLYNHILEHNGYLLLTSSISAQDISYKINDLQSRLKSISEIKISAPDDDLLRALLIKNFSDRQLNVNSDVIDYMILRVERSCNEVYKLVNQIDVLSMQHKNNITIPFIRKIIEG